MRTIEGRDVPVEGLTVENYQVPKGEERFYHVVIEVVQFDPKTGKKLSKPRVQKFGRKTWEGGVRESLRKQGYTITVLHNPVEWEAKQKAAAEVKAKADAEAKAKAEKEAFDAAVEAKVKERLAAEKKAAAEAEKKAAKEAEKAVKTDTKEDAGK